MRVDDPAARLCLSVWRRIPPVRGVLYMRLLVCKVSIHPSLPPSIQVLVGLCFDELALSWHQLLIVQIYGSNALREQQSQQVDVFLREAGHASSETAIRIPIRVLLAAFLDLAWMPLRWSLRSR